VFAGSGRLRLVADGNSCGAHDRKLTEPDGLTTTLSHSRSRIVARSRLGVACKHVLRHDRVPLFCRRMSTLARTSTRFVPMANPMEFGFAETLRSRGCRAVRGRHGLSSKPDGVWSCGAVEHPGGVACAPCAMLKCLIDRRTWVRQFRTSQTSVTSCIRWKEFLAPLSVLTR
jgi:hypothetical protein